VGSERLTAAGPDEVGLDDVGFDVAEHGGPANASAGDVGAANASAEQGEVWSAEEIEEASWRAGDRVT
jgi:hypothetical protein